MYGDGVGTKLAKYRKLGLKCPKRTIQISQVTIHSTHPPRKFKTCREQIPQVAGERHGAENREIV